MTVLTCEKCGADCEAEKQPDGSWHIIRVCDCSAPVKGNMSATVVAAGGLKG